jgi:hypothetical protein
MAPHAHSEQLYSSMNPRPTATFPCPGAPPSLEAILKQYGILNGPIASALSNNPRMVDENSQSRRWSWTCHEHVILVEEQLVDGEPVRVTLRGRFPFNPVISLPKDIHKIQYAGTMSGRQCEFNIVDPAQIRKVMDVLATSSYQKQVSALRAYEVDGHLIEGVEGSDSGGCIDCLFFFSDTSAENFHWSAYLAISGHGIHGLSTIFFNDDLMPTLKKLAIELAQPCAK